MSLVEPDKFTVFKVKGSLYKILDKRSKYSFFVGGKENAEIATLEIGIKSQEQVDELIDKLLDVKIQLGNEG